MQNKTPAEDICEDCLYDTGNVPPFVDSLCALSGPESQAGWGRAKSKFLSGSGPRSRESK